FVEGDITPLIEVSTRQITVRSGRNDELTTEGFRIYSRIRDDLKITDVDSSDPHISATFTPLPKLLESSQMASGYVGTVEIAPGLPQGQIQAQLTLHTNCAEHPAVTLQVVGRTSGDVLMTPSETLDF